MQVVSAGGDSTARVWSAQTGRCLQVLEGHTDEIFSCAVNYDGDAIITGARVCLLLLRFGSVFCCTVVHVRVTLFCSVEGRNTCRVWQSSLRE